MMKSPSVVAWGALLIVSFALGCNAILGTTHGTPEGAGGSGGAASSASVGGSTSSSASTSADATASSSVSATASSTSVGGGGSASSSSAGGGGGTSSASTTSSTGSGPCLTDEDGDGVISWQCGGPDCADQDSRAHPGADFTPGAAIMGLSSPTTLPYDFDCVAGEETQTAKLSCTGLICPTPATTKGYQIDVACGASGVLGHCAGSPCAWVADGMSTVEICK